MLYGNELAMALRVAIEKKGVSDAEIARVFGVKPPSVNDWKRYGRIHKKHIPTLLSYFGDFVGPDHWGLAPQHSVAEPRAEYAVNSRPPIQESPQVQELLDLFFSLTTSQKAQLLKELNEKKMTNENLLEELLNRRLE